MLLIGTVTFACALWLGGYLLARDYSQPRLFFTGWGLLTYALVLGVETVQLVVSDPLLEQIQRPFLFLPAVCWLGAIWHLLAQPPRVIPGRVWGGLAVLVMALAGLSNFDPAGYLYVALTLLTTLALFGSLLVLGRDLRQTPYRRPYGLALAATLFFGLGIGLLLFPLGWFSPLVMLWAVGLDLLLLGTAMSLLNALEEGESFLPDFGRSLLYSLGSTLLFGGQVAVMMNISGITPAWLMLLLMMVASAALAPLWAGRWQSWVDQQLLPAHTQRERQELQEVAEALPRLNPEPLPAELLDSEEFVRLTRRALSHLPQLAKLASNPLVQLPLLDQPGRSDTLERAKMLQQLLTQSIQRLKPNETAEYGLTEAWQLYNAVYYPYVVGLRPYRLRLDPQDLNPAEQAVLEWFRTQVPERTLYNWQNNAAALIAQDLREQIEKKC